MSNSYLTEIINGSEFVKKDTPDGYIPCRQIPVKNYDIILLTDIQTKILELKELFEDNNGYSTSTNLKMLSEKVRETYDEVSNDLYEIECDMTHLIEYDTKDEITIDIEEKKGD